MPTQPSHAPLTDPAAEGRRQRRSERAPRTDWRLGGRTVQGWREWLLAVALIALGAAVLLGTAVTVLWTSPWAPAVGTVILWVGLAGPVVWAFTRSRPAGLLRFRALDLLYGLVLGAILRTAQGWLELATGGSGAFPSYPTVDGALPTGWLLTDGVGAALIAPVLEELFFRGVLLVALFTVLRRPLGAVAAGVIALCGTTGVFVLVHALTLTLSVGSALSLALLGAVCAALVLLTGRTWGAVLVHVVFNVSYVVLGLVGTFLSGS